MNYDWKLRNCINFSTKHIYTAPLKAVLWLAIEKDRYRCIYYVYTIVNNNHNEVIIMSIIPQPCFDAERRLLNELQSKTNSQYIPSQKMGVTTLWYNRTRW